MSAIDDAMSEARLSKHEEARVRRQSMLLQKAIGFGKNIIPKELRTQTLRHKAREVACQTDPVEIGELQFGYSDNSDNEGMSMKNMRVEQGTDAPKFIILNVLPGKVEQPDPFKAANIAGPEVDSNSRIRTLVNKIKYENEK